MVPDVPEKDMKLDVQAQKVSFHGHSDSKKATYKVDLDLYAEVDPEHTKTRHTGRAIELVLRKKELKEEFWPRLLKENKKYHFLKTDFDKWVDEDDQDEAPDDETINQMAGMGGGMGGMGDMGGMGGDGGFGGIDFSKLGGAGGMPDMSALQGMAGAGAGADDDDDDDDAMPELEDEADKAADSGAGHPKIEEVP